MLQWMGGSRRKVAASRRSTHKRQKQYFEQKKQQQQRAGLDNNTDGINTSGQYHEKPNSLDIISLLNLATVACTNAREDPEANASSVNHQVLKCPPAGPKNKIIRRDLDDLKQAQSKPSGYEVKNVSPKKVFSSCADNVPSPPNYSASKKSDNVPSPPNYSGSKKSDKLYHWKTETEYQLSVLDLLADDGPNGNLEGSPVHEAHVAFSVEGLGKMGMETPVHSPQQPGRSFFNSCSSPRAARQHHSSKNFKYVMDDLELDLNAMIHDIDMPLGGSSLELPFNSRGIRNHSDNSKSSKFTGRGCKPVDSCFRMDNFFGEEERLFNSIEESEKPWNELPPYFKHLASEEDYDFITLDAASGRYHIVDGSWDFSPTLCYFGKEDEKDNMSLLSEESCSSSTARDGKAKYSASNFMKLGESMRKHGSKLCRSRGINYNAMNVCAEETWYKDSDELYQGKNQKGLGRYADLLSSGTNPRHHSKELFTVQKDLESRDTLLFEEGYTSIDIDLGLGSFCRTSIESDSASLDWKFWSKDLGEFPVSKHSSCKRSKLDTPVKCAPFGSFLSEEEVFQQPFSPMHSYDPSFLSNIGPRPRKPEIFRASRAEVDPQNSCHATDSRGYVEFPTLSGWENGNKDDEDKSEFRPTECEKFPKEPENEVSVGNNDLSSENDKVMDAPGSKDNYNECMETKDETTELIESMKTSEFSEHAEETSSAIKEVPQSGSEGKQQFGREKINCGTKGNNSRDDPSYQVMLESYVLQLLCVQKVLKEASEQESEKKV